MEIILMTSISWYLAMGVCVSYLSRKEFAKVWWLERMLKWPYFVNRSFARLENRTEALYGSKRP